MEHQKIKLFGNRDFSENFDMTLNFIKLNYGAILRGICILIPLILIFVFLTPNTQDIAASYSYDDIWGTYAEIFTLNYIISFFLSVICTFLIYLYVIAYMALYAKSPDGVVKSADVWSKVLNALLPTFIASIIFGILVGIGAMLCLIPGIILYVYFGFYIYVYVNEDRSMMDSFTRSLDLVKNNWWITFGYGLIFALLIFIGRLIFAIPSFLTGLGSSLEIEFLSSDIFFYIVTLISGVGDLMLLPILYMAMGVMYYSHRNKLEGLDMESEIDNIGNDNQTIQNINEYKL
jgi:hypothetical protein